jgi:ornithine cyclodeaminase
MIRAFALHSRGEGRVFPVVREQLHTGGVFGGQSAVPCAADRLSQ